jgi:hypothetical protein
MKGQGVISYNLFPFWTFQGFEWFYIDLLCQIPTIVLIYPVHSTAIKWLWLWAFSDLVCTNAVFKPNNSVGWVGLLQTYGAKRDATIPTLIWSANTNFKVRF